MTTIFPVLARASTLVAALLFTFAACGQEPTSSNAPVELPSSTAEAEALLAREEVRAAIGWLDAQSDAAIETLIELNEIPAPPFQEGERAEAVAERFRAMGLEDVSIDAVGNVLARRPGTSGARTIAVVAHLDTVFPPGTDVTVQREGNTFTAPGIGDNTRGLVMMLSLAEALQYQSIQTEQDILFVGSVGEEGLGDLRGVRHLFRGDDHGIDSFIAIDGGDTGRLVTSAVGSYRYRVTFTGPGGHSYGAFGRAHPHQALALAITEFTRLATPVTAEPGPKATFSVGRIGGGTSVNSIPFESWMEVDMRSVDPRRLDALDAAFQEAVAFALEEANAQRALGAALEVEIESVGRRPAGEGSASQPLVRHAIAALEVSGYEAELSASSTDANIPIWLGVPAVTISRGGVSANAHALDESWTAEDVLGSEQVGLLLLLLEAGLYTPEG